MRRADERPIPVQERGAATVVALVLWCALTVGAASMFGGTRAVVAQSPLCTQPVVSSASQILAALRLVDAPATGVSAKARTSSVAEGGPGPITATFEVTQELPLPQESSLFRIDALFQDPADDPLNSWTRDGFFYSFQSEAGRISSIGGCIAASGAVSVVPAGTRMTATLTWGWYFNNPPGGSPVLVPWPANERFTLGLYVQVVWGGASAVWAPFGSTTVVAGPSEGEDAPDSDSDGIPDVVDPTPDPPPPPPPEPPQLTVGPGLVQPGSQLGALPPPLPPSGRVQVQFDWPARPIQDGSVAFVSEAGAVTGAPIAVAPTTTSLTLPAPEIPGEYVVAFLDGDGTPAAESNTFTVGVPWKWEATFTGSEPDYGIYWFRSGTDGLRAIPGQEDDYFDPDNPTLIYIHGWQPGTAVSGDRESFALPDTLALLWGDTGGPNKLLRGDWPATDQVAGWRAAGWNVGIFYWDVFADEPGAANCDSGGPVSLPLYGELATLGAPCRAENKIWNPVMRWRHADGTYQTSAPAGTLSSSAAVLFRQEYVKNLTGADPSEVRIAGHSLGGQMAIRGTSLLATSPGGAPIPDRVALLDAYVSPALRSGQPGANRLAQMMNELRSLHGVQFEWYRTTNLPELSGTMSAGLDAMKAEANLIRVDLGYLSAEPSEVSLPSHVALQIALLRAACLPATRWGRSNCALALDLLHSASIQLGVAHADGTNMHKAVRYWYFLSFGTSGFPECTRALPLPFMPCPMTTGRAPSAGIGLSQVPIDACWIQAAGMTTPTLRDDVFERRSSGCEPPLIARTGDGIAAFQRAWAVVQSALGRRR